MHDFAYIFTSVSIVLLYVSFSSRKRRHAFRIVKYSVFCRSRVLRRERFTCLFRTKMKEKLSQKSLKIHQKSCQISIKKVLKARPIFYRFFDDLGLQNWPQNKKYFHNYGTIFYTFRQKSPRGAQERPKSSPRGFQDAPKTSPETLKTSPRPPKKLPRRLQDPPRGSQDAPKTFQDTLKTPQAPPNGSRVGKFMPLEKTLHKFGTTFFCQPPMPGLITNV